MSDEPQPSVAWAVVRDLDVDHPDARCPGVLPMPDHPARTMLLDVAAEALGQMAPASAALRVSVVGVYTDWPLVQPDEALRAEIADALGVRVPLADVPGWLALWAVEVTSPRGEVHGRGISSAQLRPEICVQLADLLQDAFMDNWNSVAMPPCPRHAHPLRPEVRDGGPWWVCPSEGPVRPWGRQPARGAP